MTYDQHPTDHRHGGKMTVEQMAGRIAELEVEAKQLRAVLAEIAEGDIDDSGYRRNHISATVLARKALGLPD